MNSQLSLIPDSPIQNADPLLLKSRPLADVTESDVLSAFRMCNGRALKHGWKAMESVDEADFKQMRQRLCQQYRIDGEVLTGLHLMKKVLQIIENDNFLRTGLPSGMSVAWMIGKINFKKICTGKLGRSNNAAKNSVSPYTAELMR